jgi:AraC-like DNA-binding protein
MQDRLAPLLERFHLSASVFHSGALCGLASFDEADGVGHLHLFDDGEAFLAPRAGGEFDTLPCPALVLFPKPTTHRLFVPEGSEATLLCATVRFGGGASDPVSRSLPSPLVIDLAKVPALHGIARLLFDEAFGGHCGRQQALDRLVELLLIHVLRHVLDAGLVERGAFSGLGDAQLAKVLIALHARPADPWALERMADVAGMSRARFAAHFHAVVGQTPGDYLAGYRLALAEAALRRGRSVKQVAAEVGYGSASALARVFRARLGIAPGSLLRNGEPLTPP